MLADPQRGLVMDSDPEPTSPELRASPTPNTTYSKPDLIHIKEKEAKLGDKSFVFLFGF